MPGTTTSALPCTLPQRQHARIRDIAATCGVTERTAQAIIGDLEAAGYLTRTRALTGDPDQVTFTGAAGA
jgi:DNA-binding MarR family transcriptional regulator